MRLLSQGDYIAPGKHLEDVAGPGPVLDVLALWGRAAKIRFGEAGGGEVEDEDCDVGNCEVFVWRGSGLRGSRGGDGVRWGKLEGG